MTKEKSIYFPIHEDDNGSLAVFQVKSSIPFEIKRVFTVSAKKNDIRGAHAHKQCTQLLICVSGSIEVVCDDGLNSNKYILNGMNHGLIIPPRIWATQRYISDNAVLMVLCDRCYESEDYIHDYKEFIELS